jgi:uncharacterized protein YcbX
MPDPSIRVAGLFSYPVKSCGALSHRSVSLDARGPAWDRRWMVVAADGTFLTQRQFPQLAIVQPSLDGDDLVLRTPAVPEVRVPLRRPAGDRLHVRVWDDDCEAWDEGDAAARLLTAHLGTVVRLVRMADDFVRAVNPDYAPRPAHTGFADAFPVLVVSEASLDELNRRLAERGAASVPMSRFRPNLVLSGGAPFGEDEWKTIRIGGTTLDLVKPCERCATTRVDQARGEVADAREPLATLATFRRLGREVTFGRYAIHREPGPLAVGDAVVIEPRGSPD